MKQLSIVLSIMSIFSIAPILSAEKESPSTEDSFYGVPAHSLVRKACHGKLKGCTYCRDLEQILYCMVNQPHTETQKKICNERIRCRSLEADLGWVINPPDWADDLKLSPEEKVKEWKLWEEVIRKLKPVSPEPTLWQKFFGTCGEKQNWGDKKCECGFANSGL